MSHGSQSHQNRGLQPTTVSAGAFSTSPSMALPAEQLQLQHSPYQSYGYGPQDSPFTFPQPPQAYRPHPPLKLPEYQQIQTQQQLGHPGQSPTNARKRGASELGEMSGPSGGNPGAYQGLMGNPTGDMDVTVGAAHSGMQSPVVKKGRTNTPWTPAEEQRLKTQREAGRSWSEIAKTFPNRTEGSVKKHWYKDMHYAEFAEDEVSAFEAALLQAIKDYENNKWKVIGQKVGKPAKACEQFAKEKGWKV